MIGEPGTGQAHPGSGGPGQPANGTEPERPIQIGFERFLSLTRLLTLIPVLFLLVDAAASFIYGTDILVRSSTGLTSEPAKVGGRLGVFLVVMDTFLVGATLMVSAFGFYELFVVKRRSSKYWLPGWLRMHDLDDLKARVTSMLILVAAITFVDRTVESQDEQEVLFLGLGISIIIVALTLFLWFGRRSGPQPEPEAVLITQGGGDGGPAGGTSGDGGQAREGTPARAQAQAAAQAGAEATVSRRSPRAALRLAPVPAVPSAGGAAGDPGSAPRSHHRRRLAAILGVARRHGDWTSAPGTALAVAGYARIDLSAADLAEPEIGIRASAILGMVSIVVPPGTHIAESGVAVLGLRLGQACGAAAAPRREHRLHLYGVCVLGVVRVRCQAAAAEPEQPKRAPAVTAVVAPVDPPESMSADPAVGGL